MTLELPDAASVLFLEIWQLDDAARKQRLDESTGHDPELRQAVEELLRHHDEPASFLGQVDRASERPRSEVAAGHPERIGPYRILSVLGRGGMGIVYRAEQQSPRRMVALKVLAPHCLSVVTAKRLAHEAEVLGRLQHQGIAQIHDAGTFDSGGGPQPYLAMELVEGVAITRWAAEQNLDVRSRVELVIKVCDALQHAHERSVIHRDLKPANILVHAGQPKVLDFGIARSLDRSLEQGAQWQTLHTQTLYTQTGQLVGTLPYMSPEQVRGKSSELDARSDVYALGVLLYELLAGHVPLDVANKPLTEVTRLITEETATQLGRIDPHLRGDLETIADKALRKDPNQRYQSAAALGADLHCYLRSEPILARPLTTLYQLRKFARRNRALVAGVLATLCALTLGLIGTAIYAKEASNLAVEEQRLRKNETQLREAEVAARTEADAAAERLRRSLYQAEMRLCGGALRSLKGRERIREITANWWPIVGAAKADLRGWEWHFLDALANAGAQTIEPEKGGHRLHPVYWDADGRIAVAGQRTVGTNWAFELGFVDVATGGLLHKIGEFSICGHDRSPDRKLIALRQRSALDVREYPGGALRTTLSFAETPLMSAWSHDGSCIATITCKPDVASDDKTVVVRRVADGATIATWGVRTGTHYQLIGYAHDGQWLAVGNAGVDFVRTSDWQRERLVAEGKQPVVIVWHPREPVLAVGSRDGSLDLYSPQEGHLGTLFARHRAAVLAIAWSPNADQIATGASDGEVRVFDAKTGHGRLLGAHRAGVVALCWSPDGKRIASGARTMRIWDLHRLPALRTLTEGRAAGPICWHPDGERLAVKVAGKPKLLDAGSGAVLAEFEGHPVFHGNGELLAYRRGDTIVMRSVDDPTPRGEFTMPGSFAFFWHPNEPVLAFKADKRFWLWRLGCEPAPCSREFGPVSDAHWSPDGREIWLLMPLTSQMWRLDVETGLAQRHVDFDGPKFCLDPQSPRGAVANDRHTVQLWSRADSATTFLHGHDDKALCVAWSPDGRRVASGSSDRTARIWDPAAGAELLSLEHDATVTDVAWSPNGRMLATASDDGALRIWDSAPGLRR